MRFCRFEKDGQVRLGFYTEEVTVDIEKLYKAAWTGGYTIEHVFSRFPDSLLAFLPPNSDGMKAARSLWKALEEGRNGDLGKAPVTYPLDQVKLLTPIPNPPKLFLLAGNYAAHIEEGGRKAEEKQNTFPYFFMKPIGTTLNHPGDAIEIPPISPDRIDWEAELGAVIGKGGKKIPAESALEHVAGYVVVNDISDREFHPNPGRVKREMDGFFDWLHGKWHDGFAPVGPCITSADTIPDPQSLRITLKVNGETKQDSTTGKMIFGVAELIAFISSFVTL